MCSKPNPADAQVCQYCQARLKPLIVSQDDSSQPEPASNGDQSSDWLGDFRSDDAGSLGGDEEAFDQGDDADGGDWFSRLGSEEEEPATPSASKPEWLEESTDQGDPNLPDWMEELGVSQQISAESPSEPTEGESDDLRTWLDGLADIDDSDAQSESELQDGEPSAGSNDDEMSDWLSSLGAEDAMEEPSGVAEDSGDADTGLPDWLNTFETKDEGPSELSALPQPEMESADELPDWLGQPEEEQTEMDMSFEDESEAEPAAEPADEIPDWMTVPGGLPDAKEEPQAEPSSDGVPDWLSDFGDIDLGATGEETDAEEAEPLTPAWLDETEGGEVAEAPPLDEVGAATEPEPPTQPVPDWLSQFEQVTSLAGADEEYPGEEAEIDDGTEFDWLTPTAEAFAADGQVASAEEAAEEGVDAEEIGAEESEVPDWLSEVGSLELGSDEEAPASAFVFDDTEGMAPEGEDEFEMPDLTETPDWLANVSAMDVAAEETPLGQEETPADVDVTPAELPVWLESMRPVEAAAPTGYFRDESDDRVESAGPLSGLRGILQAEPDISNFRKPAVYVNKLPLSDGYQAHVALLRELTDAEGRPQPAEAVPPIKSQTGLRLIIFISLLAAAFFGLLFSDVQQIELPAGELPAEIRNLRSSIEALSPNAPVLVAVDYEAASSAEMTYPVSQVLNHLQQKDAFLAMVSTRLSGPMLAELMLNQVEEQQVISYTNYTNFGYIPGGTVGLVSFARAPTQAIPNAIDTKGWADPALSNVWRMQDFALIVVMTDNADIARMWVEQVRPELDADTPLVMVLSAQAEPLVRPYFQPSLDETWLQTPEQIQISGYVAGIVGAAAYQSKMNPQTVFKEWDAFAIASLVSIVLIALGGLANLGLAMSSRPKNKR